ncbi:MAG: hypothetical protein ACYCW6_27695 [Candidatus Xenobia bacterium]
MTTISNGYPLYVKTMWPGPGGLHESDSVVQPGGTLVVDGESTIEIPKTVDVHHPDAQPRWEATLSSDGRTATPLTALPDGSVSPYTWGRHPFGPTPKFCIATQCFQLPFMGLGTSHLTLVARSVAGEILYKEDFNVQGALA